VTALYNNSDTPDIPKQRKKRIVWKAVIVLIAMTAGGFGLLRLSAPSQKTLINQARIKLATGDWAASQNLTSQILDKTPNSFTALLIAGNAAVRAKQLDEAVRLYQRALDLQNPINDPAPLGEELFFAGKTLYATDRVAEAESYFRLTLEATSKHPVALNLLTYLLAVEGRLWECRPFLLTKIQQNDFTIDSLRWLGNRGQLTEDPELLNRWRSAAPGDPLPRVGAARVALLNREVSEARNLLAESVKKYPHESELQVRYGEALLESSDKVAFSEWHSQLPTNVENHPDLWVLRGRWASQVGNNKAAIRCFLEAIRRDPDQQFATFRVGQLLIAQNQPEQAAPFLKRAKDIGELVRILDRLYLVRNDSTLLQAAARHTENLGRLWEAWAWYQLAIKVDPTEEKAKIAVARLRRRIDTENPSRVLSEYNYAIAFDTSGFEILDWESLLHTSPTQSKSATKTSSTIAFNDVSASVGIEFSFFNATDPNSPGPHLYEFSGGGSAVLDYDLDGWPEIYFTQGCPWPPKEHQTDILDNLFRNLEGQAFIDVTSQAGLSNSGFGQGATVADFNSDGFPDLYVCNIGKNRLLQNNGDGTFSDVTVDSLTAGNQWSSSCALVDLNADALPDLYVVNYLTGKGVYSRICQDPDGLYRHCFPSEFSPSADQVYLNCGDGTFEGQTKNSGIEASGGMGLGIVAADFGHTGQLDLYVANDTTPNFYFANQTPARSEAIQLEEFGLSRGLAYDFSGKSLAGMGIATGDANGDGRVDLFVTNYLKELNTLYIQQDDGFFEDKTEDSGLASASYHKLGFGTQFLDADLDGWQDIVVVNGHVDDFSSRGDPFRMRPQFFQNLGQGQFHELSAEQVGPWFDKQQLGRALTRIDWNRDGLPDFAVTHLDTPVSLLENRSTKVGNFLSLQLRGVQSARDAIGAVVTVKAGSRSWTQQLTAGDGYFSSNHRVLTFGIGQASSISSIQVRWPAGTTQEFKPDSIDGHYLIIEGLPQLVPNEL